MQETEIVERLVENEQRSKSNSKRIDEIEAEVKENRELTIAVKEIATEIKHIREEQNKMNERLKIIEEKPVKDYEETKKQIKSKVVSFFVGIILTAIAFALGLSKFM